MSTDFRPIDHLQPDDDSDDYSEIVRNMTAQQQAKLRAGLSKFAKSIIAEDAQEQKDQADAALIRELQQLQKYPTKNKARIDQIVKQLGW